MGEGDLIAYFCAEFGFHELPIYSGSLSRRRPLQDRERHGPALRRGSGPLIAAEAFYGSS